MRWLPSGSAAQFRFRIDTRLAVTLLTVQALFMTASGPARAGPDASNTRTSAARAISEQTYATLMRRLGDRLEADLRRELARGRPADRTELAVRLMPYTPDGEKFQAHRRELLRQLGVTGEQLAGFMVAHPAVVEREAKAVADRFFAIVAKLAPPSTESTAPLRPDAPPGLGGWTRVRSSKDLATQLSNDGRVIIVVRAQWNLPGIELETKVLGREDVRAKLTSYTRVFLDVTDDEDQATEETRRRLGVETLPALLVYTRGRPLRTYLLGKGPRPQPAVDLRMLVTVEEFLERLPR